MASFYESVKQKLANAYCGISDFSVWYSAHAAQLLENTPVGGLANVQAAIFRHWNTRVCHASPDSALPPAFSPPFTGGQCVGKRYLIRITVNFSDTTIAYDLSPYAGGGIFGKITEVLVYRKNNSTWRKIVYNSGASTIDENWRAPGFSSYSVSISPFSGVDDCGDPEAAGATPSNEPLTHTEDVDYEDENGIPQVASGVNFTFGLPYLEEDGTISVPYEVCYAGVCYQGKLNFGDVLKVITDPIFKTAENVENILETLEELKKKIDEIEVFASVPEAYQIRIEANRKQLIIMYAEKTKDSAGKSQYARNRLSQSIPHWNGSKEWGRLPIWTRGRFWGKAILADNSKIYVLADSKSRAQSVVGSLLTFVSSGQKAGAIITTGEMKNVEITARKGYPKYARYFPQGQATLKEDVQRFDINL